MISNIPAFKSHLNPQQREVASKIDNTYLAINGEEADKAGVDRVCEEAKKFEFPAVCVRPEWIGRAKKNLDGGNVKVATVIGFPKVKMPKAQALKDLGNIPTHKKILETQKALNDGADELDVVVNVPMVVNKKDIGLYLEALEIFETVGQHDKKVPVKFIMETGILNDEQMKFATREIADAKADAHMQWKCDPSAMYKTSTGFVYDDDDAGKAFGATEADVKFLLKEGRKNDIGVKASGGIKDPKDARKMVKLGVDRIGASKGSNLIG